MSTPILLSQVAHARSGDKGDHANVAVFAHTEAGYRWLLEQLTESRVLAHFQSLGLTSVTAYPVPNLRAINFVLTDTLGGGASRSLWTDTQGKTLAMTLLSMRLDAPDNLAELLPRDRT